jgi:hypothetical protein
VRQPSSWTAHRGARQRDGLHGQAGVAAGDREGGSVPELVGVATDVQRNEEAEEAGRGMHDKAVRGGVVLCRRHPECAAAVPGARGAEVGSTLGGAGVSSDALGPLRC